ncbi:YceI family protein [Luteolibacter pohnpeiensis]|uniref:YceI family protein n=1 Tax=Luteolibacter pohnpeiensis TaxID=454153 RepID=A0A934SD47_9BACT|nr:YceI family protein [Luteolibacter pohnpeiensis]MBK1883053.1 YceI family protein [Luteolibacter pohnpeiensis]
MKAFTFIAALALFPVVAQADRLEVDQTKSRIQVDAKATGHAFTGTLQKYTSVVTGDTATNLPTGFTLNWAFSDLKTGEAKRDKEMITWLGGGNPKGSFVFTKTWNDKKSGKDYAMGELTINGVAKTISFPFTVKRDGDWVTIDGEAAMNYKNHGLPLIRAMAIMTVEPQLKVRFHLVGELK